MRIYRKYKKPHFYTKRKKKKGGALTHMYWRKYSVAGNVYKILRKFSWSINPLGITVILFWSLEYFHCDNMTIWPDSQSCTELVTRCEQQRQLQSTLFVMMRHCEYSSLLCILFAKGVTSWKAEWMRNYCCYVWQMRLGHSSCFVVIQVFSTFVLHWRVTPTKTKLLPKFTPTTNSLLHGRSKASWRSRIY